MTCSCCTSSIIDGSISKSEFDSKVFNLQCRYKDMVASFVNRWKYGVYCPDDEEKIIEAKALLRLLTCYRVEEEVTENTLTVPQCYTDYLNFNGIDLTNFVNLPSPSTSGYFFILDSNTDTYYILLGTGYYAGNIGNTLSINQIISFINQGIPNFYTGGPDQPEYFTINVLCSGSYTDLTNAIYYNNGIIIPIYSIPQADILKIVQRLESIFECSH